MIGELRTTVETRSGERATRRRVLQGSVAAMLMAGMTWRNGAAQDATPAATPAVAASVFPVTIVHALGETTVPERPERILSTDMNEAVDSLLAIGLQPVYYGLSGVYIDGVPVWVTEAGLDPGIPFHRIARFEIDVERVAAMQPDLILGPWLEEPLYDLLAGIAPTLVVKASDATTW
jgi:iron complex transport system substrate-binding protein